MENQFTDVLSDLKSLECISEKQLSELLSIKEATLRTWRARGRGPQFIKAEGKKGSVRYPLHAIQEWYSSSKIRGEY